MSKFKRFLIGASSLGVVGFGSVAPAQAGPGCLPYVTDSGQIVVICRQEAAISGQAVAASEEDKRSQFPDRAPWPEATQGEQATLAKAEAEKNPGIRRGSGR